MTNPLEFKKRENNIEQPQKDRITEYADLLKGKTETSEIYEVLKDILDMHDHEYWSNVEPLSDNWRSDKEIAEDKTKLNELRKKHNLPEIIN